MGRGAWKGAVEGAKDGFISGFVAGGVASGISAMQGNTLFCFVAGTTVLTTLGKKAIETIQVGDTVPCVDHITGEASEKRVVSTSVNKVDTLVELVINGESIQCTDTHPFQVKGKGWVNAGDLQVGDLVYDKEWNTAPIERVEFLRLPDPVEVYNFEVEDCHTYYVGDGLWLVHNTCKGNWSKGSYDSPSDSAIDHFARHGREVGATNLEQYTNKATSFANNALSKRLKRTLVDGFTKDVYRYTHNGKYVDLMFDGFEHLIVSFGKV